MQFTEMGNMSGKTLMLLPGTCCDWQANFETVIPALSEKYHLICVNYDGFDKNNTIFSDMLSVTGKIEEYILNHHNGRVDGALGSSLGSSFVGQIMMRKNIHIDNAIFGSPDLDQCGIVQAKLQTMLFVPFLTGAAKKKYRRKLLKKMLMQFLEMDEKSAEKFMECFSKFRPESIRNEYYSDLLTWLDEDINVEGTKAHFIYARKMGKKYLERYKRYFHDPDIRGFEIQHEQWLFGNKNLSERVLNTIDDFMGIRV
ncbi:hypothetical protein SAMN05216349_1396 [Oribacterium sp. KHPX15]|uniref:alpha/beta fold hydrolase n=1 Tax=Oribacterium sp. KHPX15 TaxID=1855342 RepID=UPI00089C8E9F|nr:2-hydroxy-6-oxo-6-phenylhexa-2,4-dienoate hydrolase [Oribacterium sp. KHPX15]SEA85918.1 hypothetical protein SAMN05216349_1396 [Oribacterium sp. KHPX15]